MLNNQSINEPHYNLPFWPSESRVQGKNGTSRLTEWWSRTCPQNWNVTTLIILEICNTITEAIYGW